MASYTAQQMIDDAGIPVSTVSEIEEVFFNKLQGLSFPAFFNDWVKLGRNDLQDMFENLYFPTLAERNTHLNV